MERFQLLGRVKHTVTDVITLTVEAENEEEAFDKARRVLEVFPRTSEEDGVPYCYIEHRKFHNTKVEHIENMDTENSA